MANLRFPAPWAPALHHFPPHMAMPFPARGPSASYDSNWHLQSILPNKTHPWKRQSLPSLPGRRRCRCRRRSWPGGCTCAWSHPGLQAQAGQHLLATCRYPSFVPVLAWHRVPSPPEIHSPWQPSQIACCHPSSLPAWHQNALSPRHPHRSHHKELRRNLLHPAGPFLATNPLLTLGSTSCAAKQLRHDLLNTAASGDVLAVVTVRGDKGVLLVQRQLNACQHSLLAVIPATHRGGKRRLE